MRLVGAIVGMTYAPEALMELACNLPKQIVVKYFSPREDTSFCSKAFHNHKCLLKILDMGLAQSNSHVIIVIILTVFRL